MEIQEINEALLETLWEKARNSERLRQNFDLRTTPEDTSQRMLNCLEPGTQVPIHRHEDTSETVICLKGKLDWIFYEELLRPDGSSRSEAAKPSGKQSEVERPNMDAGGPGRDFKEILRVIISPSDGQYGIQVPKGAWHTIEVHEPSCILEAKDGPYKG